MSTATAGDTVELLNNGSSFGAPVTHVLTQGEITAGSITLTAGTLGDGLHNISVKLSDAAGNTTTTAALPVTIDTTIATLATPDLQPGSDSVPRQHQRQPDQRHDAVVHDQREHCDGRRTRSNCSTTDRRLARR